MVVNDDGFPVDALSGLVLRDYVIEGTEERPVKTDPRARDNTQINTRPKVSPKSQIAELVRRFGGADMVVGVGGDGVEARLRLVRSLAEAIVGVLGRHGIQCRGSQCEALAEKLLGAWC
ncbi:hypothetical protein [Vulcanisaeta distributa]|uniref:hypothetical protein n=1 Tax=Vulcanisaeta distributa TaxID=164451 RepID=UPI0006CF8FB3|nr:hypothetical protein [Vulcanisaeta distributa]